MYGRSASAPNDRTVRTKPKILIVKTYSSSSLIYRVMRVSYFLIVDGKSMHMTPAERINIPAIRKGILPSNVIVKSRDLVNAGTSSIHLLLLILLEFSVKRLAADV